MAFKVALNSFQVLILASLITSSDAFRVRSEQPETGFQAGWSAFAQGQGRPAPKRSKSPTPRASDGVAVEDSNMFMVGSDLDKKVRKGAADKEMAWDNVGLKTGIEIFRINSFKVEKWPVDKKGEFFTGDSYIVLKTWQEQDAEDLKHDIYFWIGEDSTADEWGTAAYKTVELDDKFGGEPVQHREVQGGESQEFKDLFERLVYMKGGAETGFSIAAPDLYSPRLLRVKTVSRKTTLTEVPISCDSLNQGDCFVLDAGTTVYTWYGSTASPTEKFHAAVNAKNIVGSRYGKSELRDVDSAFWTKLGTSGEPCTEIKAAAEVQQSEEKVPPVAEEMQLYTLKHTEGSIDASLLASGAKFPKDILQKNQNDVLLLDTRREMMVWLGRGADTMERRAAMRTAADYLKLNGRSLKTPIHLLLDKPGKEVDNAKWQSAFVDAH